MKLQKKYLEVLFQALKGTEGVLSLTKARVRDLFLKNVTAALDQFYDERKKIYEVFCQKDESGAPMIKNELYHFDKDKVPEMSKELNVLLDEEVELDVPFPDQVKEIIGLTEYKPKTGEAQMIDEVVTKIA